MKSFFRKKAVPVDGQAIRKKRFFRKKDPYAHIVFNPEKLPKGWKPNSEGEWRWMG